MPVTWKYSPETLAAMPKLTPEQHKSDWAKLSERFRVSFDRITAQTAATVAHEKEKIAALEWCRANGSPHLPPPPEQDTPNG